MGMIKSFITLQGINDIIKFTQQASLVDGDIIVSRGAYKVDGKSLMGNMSIDVSQGISVEYPEDATKFKEFIQQYM
jgi:phosphotransferase system HPr-like phosphotransfer protein